jgi:hypothetical protein
MMPKFISSPESYFFNFLKFINWGRSDFSGKRKHQNLAHQIHKLYLLPKISSNLNPYHIGSQYSTLRATIDPFYSHIFLGNQPFPHIITSLKSFKTPSFNSQSNSRIGKKFISYKFRSYAESTHKSYYETIEKHDKSCFKRKKKNCQSCSIRVPAAKNTHTTQITDFSYLYLFRYNVVNGLQWAQKQEKKLFLSFLYRDCSVPK